jgi:glycosyltransferase involved in cell wall biosynthesis
MTPQVSILVPVYNVSKCIERCAHSLFKQTFENIEYVFVNDCTPDDSIEKLVKIIEQYPQRKEQVKIINLPENKGIAFVRNTLIDAATGKYILFADSDDYLEPDMVELLYNKAEEEGADITVCDFSKEYNSKKKSVIFENKVYSNDNLQSFFKNQISGGLWDKLILREFYLSRNIVLPVGLNTREDRFILVQLFFATNKVAKVDKVLYHYVQNSNSITNRANQMHFDNMLFFSDFLEEFLTKHSEYEKYKDYIDREKVKTKAGLMLITPSVSLRKKNAKLYYEEENIYFYTLPTGQKIVTFLNRHNLFALAHICHTVWYIKNRLARKN